MKLYQGLRYSAPIPCPYLPGETLTQAYFFADDLGGHELDLLLSTGWRKFGNFFFRPVCVTCRKCLPIRIPVHDFKISKSQRRLVRKNNGTVVHFSPLKYSDELFGIYEDHSRTRFNKVVNREAFSEHLCTISCPALLSKYYLKETLSGAGFLDCSSTALSSVYFIFRSAAKSFALGNYSILREIQYAYDEGLLYYYIGYYVEGCSVMEYKSRFFPHERYDWISQKWIKIQR